jgi:ELMO/CED-12 family
MEKNKLAEILEQSLKDDDAYNQIPTPVPPPVPRGKSISRPFRFIQTQKNQIKFTPENPENSIKLSDESSNNAETPKFSKDTEKNNSTSTQASNKPQNFSFFSPEFKTKGFFKAPEEETPTILNEQEFEIDGMGEVWEYADHSANVNQKEDSNSSSEEFDPYYKGERQSKPKTINKNPIDDGFTPITPSVKPLKNKKIDLKTRGLIAEGKMQQIQMKKINVPEEHDKNEDENDKIIDENDWDNVTVKQLEEIKYEAPKNANIFYNLNYHINVNQVIEIIENIEVDVPPPQKKSFFSRFFSCFRIKSKTLELLSAQKTKILKFSKQDFNPDENYQISMLKKIYKSLKNSDNCGITGDHWKEIGFKGPYPSKELENVGLFGLLSIQYLIEKYYKTSLEIYKQSLNNPLQSPSSTISNEFPFASVCISLSEIALNALEDNIILKQIQKSKRVYEPVLEYFCGILVFWYKYYTQNKKTIADIISTKEYVKAYSTKHVNEIFSLTSYH